MPKRKSNLQLIQDSDVQRQPNHSLKMRIDDLITIDAMTETQGQFFSQYQSGATAMVLHGCAGTGKTFIALYKALEEVLNKGGFYKKVIIVRSAVPSREIGHLPGDEKDKSEV